MNGTVSRVPDLWKTWQPAGSCCSSVIISRAIHPMATSPGQQDPRPGDSSAELLPPRTRSGGFSSPLSAVTRGPNRWEQKVPRPPRPATDGSAHKR